MLGMAEMVMNCTDAVVQCYWAIGASRNVGHLSDQCIAQLHLCHHRTVLRKSKLLHVLCNAIPNPQNIALIHDQLQYRL